MVEFIDPTLLPTIGAFIFVFAMVFGLLSYVKKFNSAVNLVIAGAFGFFAVLYEPLVSGLMTFVPIAAIIFAALFFFLILKEVFKGKEGSKTETFPLLVALALLLLVLGILWPTIGFEVAGISSTNILWIIGVVIVIVIFYAAYKHEG